MSIEEIHGQEIGFARDPRLRFFLFWSRDQNAWVKVGGEGGGEGATLGLKLVIISIIIIY